jgi:hypothetical protein
MAIAASLFAAAGRFLGRFLNMALGWATIMLFGQVPQNRRTFLSLVTLGSLAWVVAVVGVVVPELGALLVAAAPVPKQYEWAVRLAMLVAALTLPILVGVAGLFLLEPEDRPQGRARVVQVLRGYPYAAGLAGVLVFLVIYAPLRRVRALIKRWQTAHVPFVVKPGGYERVTADLEHALAGAGFPVEQRPAPRALVVPSRILARIGGQGVRAMVPDELVMLVGPNLEVLLYPSDVSILGGKTEVPRARAATATRITFTAAYLTSAKEGQQVEDRLLAIMTGAGPAPEVAHATGTATATGGRSDDGASAAATRLPAEEAARQLSAVEEAIGLLADVDERLATMELEFDEWEVLYRIRLQVERDLRVTHDLLSASAGQGRGAGGPAGDAGPAPGDGVSGSTDDRDGRSSVDVLAGRVREGVARLRGG